MIGRIFRGALIGMSAATGSALAGPLGGFAAASAAGLALRWVAGSHEDSSHDPHIIAPTVDQVSHGATETASYNLQQVVGAITSMTGLI
jgi:hypothetical protein